MRCSVSQAWICDRVGGNYTSLVCGTAAISAAAAASLLAYSAAAASTALAVACVRAVNAATARPTAAWAPPTAAVVGWNGCPSGGGARTLSSVLRPLHWLAVAATCWILTRSSPAFILGKFNSELQGGNSSQVEPTTAGPGDRSSC